MRKDEKSLTFREKLMQEHQEEVNTAHYSKCPYDYDYEGHDDGPCKGNWDGDEEMCRACWDREMPLTAEEAHDLEINAEIISAYCHYNKCNTCPAFQACDMEGGQWEEPDLNPAKQRAMLNAFEAALPQEDADGNGDDPTPIAPQEPQKDDAVNHPTHYTSGKVECIDAIESAVHAMQGERAFLTGQVIKYMWRWPMKGGAEDLRKARWYLDRLIGKEEDCCHE